MLTAIRLSKKRPRHVFFSPIIRCSSSSAAYDVLGNNPVAQQKCNQKRCNSGPPSSNSNSNNDDDASSAATPIIATRRSRKKKCFSPLLQIASSHPKNTNPPHPYCYVNTAVNNNKLLTRYQFLLLTPKQRASLQRHLIQQQKDSMSYLQQARVNVRANLNYLNNTAGSNFKKNMAIIQRLFRGDEDVWKDEAVDLGSNKYHQQQNQYNQKQIMPPQQEQQLDWERLPSEIKQNVKSNLVTIQSWLHRVTDGMIPSPSIVNDGTSATAGGSIATRVQQFHQAKQSGGLVMDRRWLAWNIALALSPGAMIGLYLYSMQEEMKDYYVKLEEQERARILGHSASNTETGAVSSNVDQSQQSSSSKKGVGISSVLIIESGGVFDKVKMAVNDLFFGGVEERVSQARKDEENDTVKQQQSTTSASTPAHTKSTTSTTPSESEDIVDPAIKLLLQRIESLERQLGTDKGPNLSEQGQLHQENQLNCINERTRQSPMQNRRDSSLAARWREEEKLKEQEDAMVAMTDKNEPSNENSITIWKFIHGVKTLLDEDISSVREKIRQKIGTLEDFGISKDEQSCEEATDVEIPEQAASSNGGMSMEEVTSSTTKEIDVEIAYKEEETGFRAWLSRRFRKP